MVISASKSKMEIMKDFLRKVVEGSDISPSDACLHSFNNYFADAVNVEWSINEGGFEAIFYRQNLEHIALFSKNGMLMEYRKNLPSEFLPESIKDLALARGEVMNALMKNKGNTIEYELIVRDRSLIRHLLLISDEGKLLVEKIL